MSQYPGTLCIQTLLTALSALSGGLDSSTTALMIFGMARLVLESISAGEEKTRDDLRMATGDPKFSPKTPQEIVSRIFHTCYMGTVNSGDETRSRAKRLAETLGAYHSDINIDEAVTAHEAIVAKTLNFTPRYKIEGGSDAEQLARQNIQARNRMVVSYELAQLSTTARKLPRAGAALLVLGSGNVDEILRGYCTFQCPPSNWNIHVSMSPSHLDNCVQMFP